MTYQETIKTLFELLALANSADSKKKQSWQQSIDANQRAGFFGKIYDSIQTIAGTEIIRHWCETGEVDCTLATRSIKTSGKDDLTKERYTTINGHKYGVRFNVNKNTIESMCENRWRWSPVDFIGDPWLVGKLKEFFENN